MRTPRSLGFAAVLTLVGLLVVFLVLASVASANHDRVHGMSGVWTNVFPDTAGVVQAGAAKKGMRRLMAVSRAEGEAARDASQWGSWLGVPGSESEGKCPGQIADKTQYYLGPVTLPGAPNSNIPGASGSSVGCSVGGTFYALYSGTDIFGNSGSESFNVVRRSGAGGFAGFPEFPDQTLEPYQMVFRKHFPGDGAAGGDLQEAGTREPHQTEREG